MQSICAARRGNSSLVISVVGGSSAVRLPEVKDEALFAIDGAVFGAGDGIGGAAGCFGCARFEGRCAETPRRDELARNDNKDDGSHVEADARDDARTISQEQR